MKRILFITPFSPSNQGVGVSYTSQLLSKLAETCKIDVVLFHYISDNTYIPDNDNITIIRSEVVSNVYKVSGLLSLFFFFPLFTSRFSWKVCNFLKKRIKAVHYDFIYFDFSQTFSYAQFLNHPNKILMSHDVIEQRYARKGSKLLWWVKATERRLLTKGVVFTFSEKDCGLMKKEYHINNSFNTTFFLNKNVHEATPQVCENYFVFFGEWSRYENYESLCWFLDYVYDKLKSDYHYKIIGRGMPLDIENRLKKYPNIEYLGFLDNPYPIISNAKAEIAPLHYGAGVKVKCVEALACGTPIIGTEVAFEGIIESNKEFLILANTPEEYVNAINNINISVENKQKMKFDFVATYNNKRLLNYING